MTVTTPSDPSLINLKDSDKYSRQIGSKALVMIDRKVAIEYEEKRKVLLDQKQKQRALEKKIEALEEKFDTMLGVLNKISEKIDNNNAD